MATTPPPSEEVWADGTRCWLRNGVRHRDGDKPAVIGNHYRAWYINGCFHRDGTKPAIIYQDGSLRWYTYGRFQRALESDGTTRQRGRYGIVTITRFKLSSLRFVFLFCCI